MQLTKKFEKGGGRGDKNWLHEWLLAMPGNCKFLERAKCPEKAMCLRNQVPESAKCLKKYTASVLAAVPTIYICVIH